LRLLRLPFHLHAGIRADFYFLSARSRFLTHFPGFKRSTCRQRRTIYHRNPDGLNAGQTERFREDGAALEAHTA
jgi:hypothetical protein